MVQSRDELDLTAASGHFPQSRDFLYREKKFAEKGRCAHPGIAPKRVHFDREPQTTFGTTLTDRRSEVVPGQKKIAALMISVGLVGCTSTGTAQLYPLNPEAGRTGALTVSYVNSGSDQGTVEVRMPDGEVLKGRYSDTDSKSGTFIGGRFVPSRSSGRASLIGDRGTRMICDFVVDEHAMGRCETSAGAIYWMLSPKSTRPDH